MNGIVVVTDLMVGFFLLWQLMTLSSYVLVRFEYKQRENVRAAMRYLIAMEAACGFIVLGAGLLARGPVTLAGETLMRYDFDAISHGLPALLQTGGGVAAAGLLCFLVGFGIKAGMWPFGQLWLPAAHPAAPAPVSALLSGVVIKTGIYGLMRSFLWLVPADALDAYPSEAWGLVLAGLGTATLFIGTTQALGQDQTKRLLAFSSIGQVGYVLLPLGACLALIKSGPADANSPTPAGTAFTPNSSAPHGIRWSKLTKKVYSIQEGYGEISEIDPVTFSVTPILDLTGLPYNAYGISPDGRFLLLRGDTTPASGTKLGVIDLGTAGNPLADFRFPS